MDLVIRIYQAIRIPVECLGHQLVTDASIGIALAPQDGTDLDQLLKNADLAMYGAKSDGRRTYRFFERAMDARVRARRTLELDLRQAIVEGEFEIEYQPIVDLRSGAVSGCEALLRWRHPERGMVSPAEFIPVAEDIGLISRLGEWVLAHGLRRGRQLAGPHQAGGQRLAGPVQEPHAGAACRQRAGVIRPCREPAGA